MQTTNYIPIVSYPEKVTENREPHYVSRVSRVALPHDQSADTSAEGGECNERFSLGGERPTSKFYQSLRVVSW